MGKAHDRIRYPKQHPSERSSLQIEINVASYFANLILALGIGVGEIEAIDPSKLLSTDWSGKNDNARKQWFCDLIVDQANCMTDKYDAVTEDLSTNSRTFYLPSEYPMQLKYEHLFWNSR